MTTAPRGSNLAAALRNLRSTLPDATLARMEARRGGAPAAASPSRREASLRDLGFHVDHLAASLEVGAPDAFTDYAVWCRDVLLARGIAASVFIESLECFRDEALAAMPPDTRSVIDACVSEAIRACDARPTERPDVDVVARAYARFALVADRRGARSLIEEELDRGRTVESVLIDVLAVAQREIGLMWQHAQISVASEHLASVVTQDVLAWLYDRIPAVREPVGTVIVCGPRGDRHQLGPHIVADVLEASGFRVWFLGTDAPEAAVVERVRELRPDIVAIGAALITHVPAVTALIRTLRSELDSSPGPRIVVVGRAFALTGNSLDVTGADAVAVDARDAVRQCRAFMEERRAG